MKTTREIFAKAKRTSLISTLLIIALVLAVTASASAQITITLPKLPKVKKPKIEQTGGGQTGQTQPQQEEFNPSPDDIYTNKEAPSDYDASLRANDTAIAVIISSLEPVRIVAKSGGVYKANTLDSRNVAYYIRANSVYPYFDNREFEKIRYGNERYLNPYLECYAKKHNLEPIKVTGDAFHPPDYDNAQKMKQALEAEQAKLAELESRLKSKLQARPNTFLPYQENPAVWEEITANRAQYMQCAVGEKESRRFEESVWLKAHRDGIKKALKNVEEYDPATKTTMGTYSEYVLYAASPKEREKWLRDKNAMDFKEPIDSLLAPLADALAKKLPTYLPDPKSYAVRNPAEEAKMRGVLTNPARYKIFKIGLAQAAWLIDKNSLGIPTARYKHGVIYLRDTQADHPYCYATYVNIKQEYAGGGTYGASYAKFIQDDLVGCPADAK